MTCKFLKLRCLQLKCQSREKIEKQGLKLSPEPLENWNLDSAKAPAVRSIAKRSVLMQYGPLCVARTPGLWRSRNSNLLTARGIVIRGRRRIGKSRLAQEFANKTPHHVFSGLPSTEGISAADQ